MDWMLVLAGAITGYVVGLTGVGGGAVFLAYLYPVRLTPPRLIAMDMVHAIPLALFAGTGHLLLGSVPTVLLGAVLSARLPRTVLRMALVAVLLAAVGAKLAWTI